MQKSYRRLARRIERSRADAVFLGGYQFSNGAQLIRDVRTVLGPDVALVAPDGFLPLPELIRGAGPAANGLYVSLAGAPDPALGPTGKRFLEAFSRTYGRPIPWYSETYAAAAAELLVDAIARSDGTRASVNRQLRTGRRYGITLGYPSGGFCGMVLPLSLAPPKLSHEGGRKG